MSGGNSRHLDLGQTSCTRVDDAHRRARQAADDRFRQWNRVHLERDARLGEGSWCGLALHRTGQTDAERLHQSFNGRMRDELLNESLFIDLDQARQLIGAWVTDYNTARPHSSLGYKTPAAYAGTLTAPKGVTLVEALNAAG